MLMQISKAYFRSNKRRKERIVYVCVFKLNTFNLDCAD
jgi:hypothetical protein